MEHRQIVISDSETHYKSDRDARGAIVVLAKAKIPSKNTANATTVFRKLRSPSPHERITVRYVMNTSLLSPPNQRVTIRSCHKCLSARDSSQPPYSFSAPQHSVPNNARLPPKTGNSGGGHLPLAQPPTPTHRPNGVKPRTSGGKRQYPVLGTRHRSSSVNTFS